MSTKRKTSVAGMTPEQRLAAFQEEVSEICAKYGANIGAQIVTKNFTLDEISGVQLHAQLVTILDTNWKPPVEPVIASKNARPNPHAPNKQPVSGASETPGAPPPVE